MKPELRLIFEKEKIGMIFNKISLPHKDVELSTLNPIAHPEYNDSQNSRFNRQIHQ